MRRGIFIFCLLLSPVPGAIAGEVQANHARVELLAQQTALLMGQENLLGVRFTLENGWHIYWTNPGDSGQPPVFNGSFPKDSRSGRRVAASGKASGHSRSILWLQRRDAAGAGVRPVVLSQI